MSLGLAPTYLTHALSPSITFSDTPPPSEGGLKPTQELSLVSASTTTVHEYPLKVQHFKDVVSLSLFFADAEGGERTRVYFVGFLGDPRNPEKEKGEHMTIPAAQVRHFARPFRSLALADRLRLTFKFLSDSKGADAPIGGLKETTAPRNTTIR